MSFRCLEFSHARRCHAALRRSNLALVVLLYACGLVGCTRPSLDTNASIEALRVCADPNNLPFSNERRDGFENKIADLVSKELNKPLHYTWWAQRRGFVRSTLNAGLCDVWIGVPTAFAPVLTTVPYYRSSYVFVSRKDRGLRVGSFDDPSMRTLLIGVPLAGDDFAVTPPARALAARGITHNVRGFPVYGDYSLPNPTARIIEAVMDGAIDIAVVWGPLAGYFTQRGHVPLHLEAVSDESSATVPFAFDISMAVRTNNFRLRNELEKVLERRRTEIDRILEEYGVPRAENEQARTSDGNRHGRRVQG